MATNSDWREIGGIVQGKWSVRGAIPDHAADRWEGMKAAYAEYARAKGVFEQAMQETIGRRVPRNA